MYDHPAMLRAQYAVQHSRHVEAWQLHLPGAGSEVTAGTLNCDGTLRVEVRSAGQATFMADLARAVEAAQGRAAPVHRVADAVAGGPFVPAAHAAPIVRSRLARSHAMLRGTQC